MPHPYIIYNGVSSEDMNLIVEELPAQPRAKRNIEQADVIGRDGAIISDLGSYATISTEFTLNASGTDPSAIHAWLQGEGWFTSSDEPDFMRWAAFYDEFRTSRLRAFGKAWDSITVPVQLWPYRHKLKQDDITLTQEAVFAGEGDVPCLPTIVVTGTGSVNLMVNECTILIDDMTEPITIDCELHTAYTTAEDGTRSFATRQLTLVDGWPTLRPAGAASNLVNWTGDITKITITPWYRWL